MRVIDEKDFYCRRTLLSSELAADGGQGRSRVSLRAWKGAFGKGRYNVVMQGPGDSSWMFSGPLHDVCVMARLSDNRSAQEGYGALRKVLRRAASAFGEKDPLLD
jgi:hypothetical protein